MEPLTFYMLVGFPCSGKSTWAKIMSEKLERPVVTLSTDRWLEDWALSLGMTYQESFKQNYAQAQKALQMDLRVALQSHSHIIWDQTNLISTTRQNRLKQIPSTYRKIGVYFDVDMKELQARMEKRNTTYNKVMDFQVVEDMWQQSWTPPKFSEGFDELLTMR